MTTIFLVGGNELSGQEQFRQRLARELSWRVSQPKILSCQFAKKDFSARSDSSVVWSEWFKGAIPDCEVMQATDTEFYEQVAWADVVYLHGGETRVLLDALPDFAKVQDAFSGKIIIGSSAGANYLSASSYSPNTDDLQMGSGLVDVSTIVHYGSEEFGEPDQWRQRTDVLAKRFSRPVVCLAEGEMAILEVA